MTPRKEIYTTIKEQLNSIAKLELVDLYRGQFDNPEHNYPEIWTAALIQIGSINYETMTEHIQEGEATIDVLLYCKDGWADQHAGTADAESGLVEIDLLDEITDKLQFLKGKQFKPLQLTTEQTETQTADGIMSYRLTFSTKIYRRTPYPYTGKKLSINNL